MTAIIAALLIIVVFAGTVAVARSTRSSEMHTALSAPSHAITPPPTDALGKVIDVLRRRKWTRRALSGGSLVLLAVAIGMLGYPFYTNVQQGRIQQRLDRELVSPELQQAYKERKVDTGDALTRLKIPKLGVDVVVVEGTTNSALRAGAGHYPQTPLPCEPGNVAIAGHRTTYGRPFHNLDLLVPGDTIVLETPIGSCTYRLGKLPFIIEPDDVGVVGPTSTPTLTLTTCHPKGSARQRLIVQAELVGEAVAA